MQIKQPSQKEVSSPGGADNSKAGGAIVDVIVDLGNAQAEILDGYQKEYLLSHFRDRRIIQGAIDLAREYAKWIPQGATVMDWGCGSALPCLILSQLRPDLKLRGLNYDMELQTFKLLWDAAGLHVESLKHAWQLPLPDESVDIVISNGVLEHVPHEQFSLAEIYRVLADEGKLIVTNLPARYSLVEWFNRTAGRPYHPRLYTLAYSKKLLLSCGFHIVWSAFREACPLATLWAAPIFRVWERTPMARHLTQNIVVVGVKSVHGIGNQDYARHNLKATLKRIQSRGNSSA